LAIILYPYICLHMVAMVRLEAEIRQQGMGAG